MSALIPILTALSLFVASIACAAQTACTQHYAGGKSPDFINRKLSAKTREICYSGYGLLHSGITRTPLYTAEHLTRSRLRQARTMIRRSAYFPEPNIPRSERSELYHYARSGFSRGHLAPSGDMPDARSQQECFSLANMVPQVTENNRGIWEGVESAVRYLVKKRGELYVVTGPLFQGSRLQRIGGAVMVPTHLFKAVYDPKRREAGAYLVENAAQARPATVSIAELEKRTGMNIFPSVDIRVKANGMKLPEPLTYEERRKRGYWRWTTR